MEICLCLDSGFNELDEEIRSRVSLLGTIRVHVPENVNSFVCQ